MNSLENYNDEELEFFLFWEKIKLVLISFNNLRIKC